jgi:hypothetical protein
VTGEPVPTVAIGTAVRDTARDRIALVMGHERRCLQLRPLEGGQAWDADSERVEPVSSAVLLRARVAEANARSRREPPGP